MAFTIKKLVLTVDTIYRNIPKPQSVMFQFLLEVPGTRLGANMDIGSRRVEKNRRANL